MLSHILIVDDGKLTEVKTLLDNVALQLKDMSSFYISVFSCKYVTLTFLFHVYIYTTMMCTVNP